MSDKSERLFRALSELSDRTIDEGGTFVFRKRVRWRRWAALAACLCLLAAGAASGLLPFPGGSGGGSGHSTAGVFQSYAGPILPLTLREENTAVTAQRAVTLDFAPWVPVWQSNEAEIAARDWASETERRQALAQYEEWFPDGGYWRTSTRIRVTDQYTLTNTADTDQTLSVLYPFVASLQNLDELLPVLTADGAEVETRLHVGAYAGSFAGAWGGSDTAGSVNLAAPDSWEDYAALLADGRYLDGALGPGPDVSGLPVIVYKLTDPYSPAENEAGGITNPTLRATFRLDPEQTTVLTCGFHGASFDEESGVMIQDFSIPQPGESGYGTREFFLLVLGEDVQDLTLQGYADGSLAADAVPLAGCGATLTRYETDLDAALREILPGLLADPLPAGTLPQTVDFETFYRAFLEHLLTCGALSPAGAERYSAGWLEDVQLDVYGLDRVCWLETELVLPAGGSVTLTASMTKQASYDHTVSRARDRGVAGYDLSTRLGSNLACQSQTVTLEDRGQIQILRQNFGFDLARGVRTVQLDGQTDPYCLEVKRREGTTPDGPPETG